MTYRKEFKFRLTVGEQEKLKIDLICQGMSSLFPARQIHSDYFDTVDLRMFSESEEGVLPRKKVRARWYVDRSQASLEKKYSSEEGRFKTSKPIEVDALDSFSRGGLFDPEYGVLVPTLRVSYMREYYQYQGMRITFDSNITYWNSRNISGGVLSDYERVVEVKTSATTSDDYVGNFFHRQTSRFSKYCRGVLAFQGDFIGGGF